MASPGIGGLALEGNPRHFRHGVRKLSFCPPIEQCVCHLAEPRIQAEISGTVPTVSSALPWLMATEGKRRTS